VRLGFDFDGTLIEGTPMRLRAGADDCLRALKAAGHHLTLHSCRCTPDGTGPMLEDEATRYWQDGEVPARTRYQWDLFSEMRDFLKAVGLWQLFDEIWTAPGKPLCDKFFDDRVEEPNFALIRRQYASEVPA
jgi:FMN phosphatase YigB (HAD superfamily)